MQMYLNENEVSRWALSNMTGVLRRGGEQAKRQRQAGRERWKLHEIVPTSWGMSQVSANARSQRGEEGSSHSPTGTWISGSQPLKL